MRSSEVARLSFLRLALSGEAGLLLLAWGLSRWLQLTPFSYFHADPAGLLWGLAGVLPLLAGLAWMLSSSWRPVRQLVALVVEHLGDMLAGQSVGGLAALATVAGVSEEVLFRGVVQPGLARSMPAGLALLVTSLLFGLVHFASRSYAILATIMGLYLGILFQLTGNLLAPVVAHAAYDFAALLWISRLRAVASDPGP
ncbi:MAG TPA: CPBP family intramembrane glutamic endopeptidase [Gemmatimonadales bacterium]|nr:CPBP family intramembrane glutamic endopeptidase [Gemmatimonadales bacterium]